MSIIHRNCCIAIALLLSNAAFAGDLIRAIRRGDLNGMRVALKAGGDPNERDEAGATALMDSAAFASAECMRLLLDAGASVNATTPYGSTALMWSTADITKIKLLLDRGANVNLRTTEGATALFSAASRENTEAVRLLLDVGADPSAEQLIIPGALRAGILQIAYSSPNPAVRELLLQKGMPPPALVALPVLPGSKPLYGPFLLSVFGFSRLLQTHSSLGEAVAGMLDLGANPNENIAQFNRVLPPLARAALLGDIESLRVLLDRGANANGKGGEGETPLMMAAATENPTAEAISLLLDHGASLDARDRVGRTALDWALMQGETEAAHLLRERGAAQRWNAPAAPLAVSRPRSAREAVKAAVVQLQRAGDGFHAQAGCISCHNESLPSIAVKFAADQRVEVDPEVEKHPTKDTFEMWRPSRENFLMGNCSIFGFLGNVTYGLFAMAEEGVAPNSITDAAASCLGSLQWQDGRWQGGDMRPPLGGRSPILYTALAVHALKNYSVPGRRVETQLQVARATEFLRTAQATDTQGESFKLLGLKWSGTPVIQVADQAKRIIALQHTDGGWSQRPTMQSDAYATGQALYALKVSGMSISNSVYRKGVDYLLRTQLEDGTWFMRSRAVGFQPYFESGFPHAQNQFISAAATSWAVIALSHSL